MDKILKDMKYIKEGMGSMSVVDLWSETIYKNVLHLTQMNEQKRMIKRLVHKSEDKDLKSKPPKSEQKVIDAYRNERDPAVKIKY